LVRNQIELLRSGNVLAKVVQTLRLNDDPDFASGSAMDAVRRELRVQQVGTSHLISVSFKASEPTKAARVVNSVINFYLQELVRASEAASSNAPALRELYQNLGPSAHVISEADPPLRADGPPAALILIAAALSGLGIAAALAILLDVLNDTIRAPRQIESALGLPCLGVIPRLAAADSLVESAVAWTRSSQGYAMRRMAAALCDASARGVRIIGVTSTVPGEGATTIATGLAQTMVAMGRSVLLIDGACKNFVDGPMCLERMTEVQNAANHPYELAIVDMPSLAEGPDVRAAARSLDGFLIVVKWGETESELVRQGLRSAGAAREKFFGAVLNMADEKMMELYGDRPRTNLGVAMSS
jgi:Mrp family chromosome partitioning ATPase